MITEQYRNLFIDYDNHTDLLANEAKLNEIKKFLELYCSELERRFHSKALNPPLTSFTRLKGSSFLAVHISQKHQHNPYLAYYDASKNIVSIHCPWEVFKELLNPYKQYDFEDKTMHIADPRYHTIDRRFIQKRIDDLLL
jgi:hypothetical protein